MGGNLIKAHGFEGRRITTKELIKLTNWIQGKISDSCESFIPILSPTSKMDHGDIDIVICPIPTLQEPERVREEGENATVPPPRWVQTLGDLLGAKAVQHNHPISTYSLDGVQIDLIGADTPERAQSHAQYMHWSPLTNILGEMFRQVETKLGIHGLTYPVRPDPKGPVLGEVLLTPHLERALNFAGLNHQRWKEGFSNDQEIFDYVGQSRLFQKDLFEKEGLNHKNRTRSRKRGNYQEWIDQSQHLPNRFDPTINWRQELELSFPHLPAHEKAMVDKYQNRLETLRTKFNGNMAGTWLRQSGRELQKSLEAFRKNFPSRDAYQAWILETPQETIKAKVLASKVEPELERE